MQQPTPPQKKGRPHVKRNARSESLQDASWPEVDVGLVAPAGDLVLVVHRHQATPTTAHTKTAPEAQQDTPLSSQYRVQSKRLQETSPYFARLLDPDKFGEGATVAETHAKLLLKYPALDAVSFDELPKVHISDVGSISPVVKSIQNLMGDFLRALHDQPLSVKVPPLANLANLAVVADRFDALPAMRQYLRANKLMAALDAKTTITAKGQEKSLPEERARQKLLVGLLLDNPSWVWHASLRLIQRGWVGRDPDDDAALWWHLPMGVEEELLFRRECILETIQSLQAHFLDLYTSKDRQCKNEPSPECDIFQLGQMIKFFKRINTLSLQGNLIAIADLPDPYEGDVADLLDSLRQAPDYQLDKYHHHCGLRARIIPLLDLIAISINLHVAICLHCWYDCRHDYAWSRSKRPLVWNHGSAGASMTHKPRPAQNHLLSHLDTRDFFMADQRLWNN